MRDPVTAMPVEPQSERWCPMTGTVASTRALVVRRWGRIDFAHAQEAMREFTARRDSGTPDELWWVEHPPVYTAGVGARPAHFPRTANGIPLLSADRGGQITYHGPGQVIIYTLLDLNRRAMTVRALVRLLEQSVIRLLREYSIDAAGRPEAPGVYAGDAKVAALGLRVRQGRCYHGLALNVDMDLAPFLAIDPCGYPGLAVTSLRALGVQAPIETVGEALLRMLGELLDPPATTRRTTHP